MDRSAWRWFKCDRSWNDAVNSGFFEVRGRLRLENTVVEALSLVQRSGLQAPARVPDAGFALRKNERELGELYGETVEAVDKANAAHGRNVKANVEAGQKQDDLKQKVLDTGGRIDRFKQRFGMFGAKQ